MVSLLLLWTVAGEALDTRAFLEVGSSQSSCGSLCSSWPSGGRVVVVDEDSCVCLRFKLSVVVEVVVGGVSGGVK